MLKKSIILTIVLLAVMGVGIYLAYTSLNDVPLFENSMAQWALVGAAVIGLIAGAARGLLKKKPTIQGDVVVRHGLGSFISHWATALGIFVAIASGIILGMSLGFFNIGPSAKTPAAVIAPLNMHYFAVAMILFGSFFFVADYTAGRNWKLLIPNMQDVIQGFIGKYFLRRKWEKEGRYLSSQKSSAMPYFLIGLVILVSGSVKLASHVWPVSADVWGWATIIHDWFTIFIILYTLVHIGMVVLMGHWPAFFSWFTGTMPRSLVEHHHPVWYDELTGKKQG